MPTNESQQPDGPVKRSILYSGPAEAWNAAGVPPHLMKFDEWIALFKSENAAQHHIDANPYYGWGQPYKDQSGPAEGEE